MSQEKTLTFLNELGISYDDFCTTDANLVLGALDAELVNLPYKVGEKILDNFITDNLADGITDYVRHHQRPGGFLCACIAGEWRDAIMLADTGSSLQLRTLVFIVEGMVPREARGSREAIDAWCARGATGG